MILQAQEWRATLARLGCAIAVAVAVWFLARAYDGAPTPRGWDAPLADFSTARADAALKRILGPERPHPTASAENDSVRVRIIYEFSMLGIDTHVDRGFACNGGKRGNYIVCATVNNLIADIVPGEGKAIILLAHYDSVAAGPGAADDGAGVATVIETARALKASGLAGRHPILAVITDGEEVGLLGAKHFLDDPKNRDRVGVVLNVEARGNQGPSLLFQTSDGNGKLIDLYAKNTGAYATSSLFPAIYKLIPNDTDLTLFLDAGFQGLNFACIGNVAHYHTPLDRRENISAATLQHHGENLLGMTRALSELDFADLVGDDAVFISIFGRWLPRLKAMWALPLSILALAAVAGAWFMDKGREPARRSVLLLPPAMILFSLLAGQLLWMAARTISAQPDPSFAHPLPLRLALALCVLLSGMICARWASPRQTARSLWGWMSVWSVAAAVFLPGASPYFLFPALVGAFAVLLTGRGPDVAGHALGVLTALVALVVWIPLVVQGEALMGLAFQPLFTLPATLAILPLIPLISGKDMDQRSWGKACLAVAAGSLIATAIAAVQPPYSAAAPQRVNIALVDNHNTGKAMWHVDTPGTLPASLRAAADFSAEKIWSLPLRLRPTYVADAGALHFPAPAATVEQTTVDARRQVAVTFADDLAANTRLLVVPPEADLQSVEIGGNSFEVAPDYSTVVFCTGPDCAAKSIGLVTAAEGPIDLTIGALRHGLPADGASLAATRPVTAVPSAMGDTTVILGKVSVPAKSSSPL